MAAAADSIVLCDGTGVKVVAMVNTLLFTAYGRTLDTTFASKTIRIKIISFNTLLYFLFTLSLLSLEKLYLLSLNYNTID